MNTRDTPEGPAQEAILDAAAQVFAEKGFAGARVEAIARAAGMNKAMLYYRVGDKARLYELVVLRFFTRLADTIVAAAEKPEPFGDALAKVLAALTGLFQADPRLPRIMSWELASGGVNVPASVMEQWARIAQVISPLGHRAGLDPICMYFSLAGAMVFQFLTKPMRERAAAARPDLLAPLGASDVGDMAAYLATLYRKAMENS